VREAESLATSTDWGATAGVYRDLMARWKASGRASRSDDDALWARFRAAQDAFFAARDASAASTDDEFRANLQLKEALLTEAERLVPVTDVAAAKAALRTLQDRWESAGKVPRADVQRIEARLRAVETAVRDADQAVWRRSNPETRARAEGAAAQLENAIAALDARRAWLEQVQRAAQDARG
jgi:DNA repair exonuclease SbcCD ATPase subunit